MASQWDAWLREHARSGKGGITLAEASRGRKYTLNINFDDDRTGATIAGRVRSSPDAVSTLATFSVSSAYDSGADVTTFTCTLAAGSGANSTGVLPADSDADGLEYFPVEFEMTPEVGDMELLFGALLPVSGRI